jgi:uncharacterized protein YjbI with pentapeptide repeats
LTALAGLLFTAVKLYDDHLAAQRQLANQVFTAAVSDLGSTNLAIRVGGVYALVRIANESRDDHWRAVGVLTAHLRNGRPWPASPATPTSAPSGSCPAYPPRPNPDLPMDLQAVVDALRGHENAAWDEGPLDLAGLDLRGPAVNLSGADLAHANLARAHLESTDLARTRLEDATLTGARLDGATLTQADLTLARLTSACLRFAHLDGAKLEGATLLSADLWGADLRGADLRGADLRGTTNLTQAQVDSAVVDERTQLPPGPSHPATGAPAPSSTPAS